MKRLILLAAVFAAFAAAQEPARFSATTGDVALTAQTTALTVQPPASGAKQWTGEIAFVYCSVACNVTQAKNGAAATATAGSWTAINPGEFRLPLTAVFTASNVGAGTTVGGILHLAAGQTIAIDLSRVTLGAASTAANYTISISSITGTANITVIGSEK